MPYIAFNVFTRMAAHHHGVGFLTWNILYISLFNGRLKLEGDGFSYSSFACRIEQDDRCVPFPLSTPDPSETCVESGCDFPLAFPVLDPGIIESNETALDINVFPCVYGLSNELLMKETAKSLDVQLLGKLTPCTGCSMTKGYYTQPYISVPCAA